MKSIDFLKENGVDIDKSLELFADVNTYNDNLGNFLIGIHQNINEIINMLKNNDLANYAVYAHSLKTDAKYFGFMKLAEKALTHEQKAKLGDMYYLSENINDLIEETNKVIVLVQEYLSDYDNNKKIETKKEDEFQTNTILVVDDSNIIRNFVKKIFSDSYNVASAKDGEEAIKIIKTNKDNDFIKTILLDLNMPKVDGFAVLEFMRQNDLFDKMPVSIISGDCTKETIDKAFTYNIVDMLGKPFNDKSVKEIVDKTIMYKENRDL